MRILRNPLKPRFDKQPISRYVTADHSNFHRWTLNNLRLHLVILNYFNQCSVFIKFSANIAEQHSSPS